MNILLGFTIQKPMTPQEIGIRRRPYTSRYPGKHLGKHSYTLASSLERTWAIPPQDTPGKAFQLRFVPHYFEWHGMLTSLGTSLQTCFATDDGSFVHTGTSTSRHSFFVTCFFVNINSIGIVHMSSKLCPKYERKYTF